MIALEDAEVMFPDWKSKLISGLVNMDVVANSVLLARKYPKHAMHQFIHCELTKTVYEITCACDVELFISFEDLS